MAFGASWTAQMQMQSTLDQSLLAELLGSVSLRELLDADVITEVEERAQGLTTERALRGTENAADALRRLGPLTHAEIAARWRAMRNRNAPARSSLESTAGPGSAMYARSRTHIAG